MASGMGLQFQPLLHRTFRGTSPFTPAFLGSVDQSSGQRLWGDAVHAEALFGTTPVAHHTLGGENTERAQQVRHLQDETSHLFPLHKSLLPPPTTAVATTNS